MKNYKYLLLCLMIGLLFSCEKEDKHINTVNLGANVVLKDTKISLFDTDEALKMDVFTTKGVTVSKIEIIKQDDKKVEKSLGEAVIKDKSATFNSAILAPFTFGDKKEPTGTFNLFLRSMLSNGKVLNNPYSISVSHAIALKSGVNQVKYKDTLTQKIYFTTATKYAKIDDIVLSWKSGKLGTYADDNTFDFKPEDNKLGNKANLDSINLKNKDYIRYGLKIGDTLYYKLTAKSKTLIDTLVTSVAIVPQTMGKAVKGKLSESEPMWNLKTMQAKDPEIELSYIHTGIHTGIITVSGVNMEFVDLALPSAIAADYFAKGNLSNAKAYFNGKVLTNLVSGLEKGKVFRYKITRKDKDKKDVIYYGLLKIGDILNEGTEDEVINFEYKEGVLVGQ